MVKIPIIKTKDFTLRPYKKGDEKSLRENINDRTTARNTSGIPFPYTAQEANNWISKNLAERKKKKPKMINFVIDIEGEVAGSVGFDNIEGHKAEVGYWLDKRYRGRGITTLALKKITVFGFNKVGFRRIYATVFPWNKASMKVLEKAGYELEGILKKYTKKGTRFLDCYLFAKTR